MENYQLIQQDLQIISPGNIPAITPFFGPSSDLVEQTKSLFKQIRRVKSNGKRTELLTLIFYLGEILENKASNKLERSSCQKVLTGYYNRVAIRTYYLFEFLGVEQIARTQYTSLATISRLSKPHYRELVQESITIAGARFEEEEVVIM